MDQHNNNSENFYRVTVEILGIAQLEMKEK